MRTRHLHWPRVLLLGLNVGFPAITVASGFPWRLMWACFAVHSALIYAIAAPGCGWLGPEITRFRTGEGKREVWLTIDDGPDGERTERLAEELRARGVRATFFVKGRNLERCPEAGRALIRAGHGMANHTFTHPLAIFWALPPPWLGAEIDECTRVLREAGAGDVRWFRAPLGLKNLFLHYLLASRGMRLIAWNVRGHDGVFCEPARVARRVARLARPGCIILLHEGRRRSNEAILGAVDALLADGYRFTIPGDESLL